MEEKAEQFDPRVYLTPIMEQLIVDVPIQDGDILSLTDCIKRGGREVVGTLIVQFGSVGFASKVEPLSLEQMAERYRKAGI